MLSVYIQLFFVQTPNWCSYEHKDCRADSLKLLSMVVVKSGLQRKFSKSQ